eukprot:gene4493-7873_t
MFFQIVLVALIAITVLFLYIQYKQYSRQITNPTTGKTIPLVRGFVGFIISLFLPSDEHQGLITTKYHQKHGDIITLYSQFQHVVSVASPEYAKLVLTDSKTFSKPNFKIDMNREFQKLMNSKNVFMVSGEDWKRHRTSINPGFYDLSIYAQQIIEKTNISMECIKKESKIADVHDILQQLTLDILGVTIFDHDFDSMRGSLGKDLQAYNEVMSIILNPKNMVYLMFTKYFQDSNSFQKELSKNAQVLLKLISNLIKESQERLEKGGKATTMLDFMIESHLNEELSEVELISNVFIFFIAGHETTAKSLSFALYLLAKHPEIQEKARKEINEVLEGKQCDYESCSKLKYLSMVIKEGMRLYGPADFADRLTTKEVVLGGYKIPKNQRVQVSTTAIHHSPTIYENPDEFIPERWEKKIPNFAWIPFSASSRVCVGNNFSLLEQNIFLATILQKFKFEPTNKNAKISINPNNRVMGPNAIELKFQEIDQK